MSLRLIEIPAKDWIENFSEYAHKIVFHRNKPKAFDRIDYAVLVIHEESNSPIAYVTVRETDHETVYWQFGGGLWGQKSILMARCYDELLKYQATKSKRMWTRVENDNWPMLKLALSRKLKISGVFNFANTVLVEFMKEFNENGDDRKLPEHAQSEASVDDAFKRIGAKT